MCLLLLKPQDVKLLWSSPSFNRLNVILRCHAKKEKEKRWGRFQTQKHHSDLILGSFLPVFSLKTKFYSLFGQWCVHAALPHADVAPADLLKVFLYSKPPNVKDWSRVTLLVTHFDSKLIIFGSLMKKWIQYVEPLKLLIHFSWPTHKNIWLSDFLYVSTKSIRLWVTVCLFCTENEMIVFNIRRVFSIYLSWVEMTNTTKKTPRHSF